MTTLFGRVKMLRFLAATAIILLLSGCTAILWSVNKSTEPGIKSRTKIKDSIADVVEYKNMQLSATRSGKSMPVRIPSEGIAFIGKKNIYILTHGADELLQLNDSANKLPLSSDRINNAIRLKLRYSGTDGGLTQFSDHLMVRINRIEGKLTLGQRKLIKDLSFNYEKDHYEKWVSIQGVIIPRESFKYPITNSNKLSNAYRVEFYVLEDTTTIHPVNIVENIIVTPVALAADIIFFPISLSVLSLITHS